MAEQLGYLAASLLVFVGVAHSYLGERYVLSKLFRLAALPKLSGSVVYMKQILRVAWHATSVAWWGLAVVVAMISRPAVYMHPLTASIGITLLVTSAVILVGTRGRHVFAWALFLVAGLCLVGASVLH